MTVNSFVYFTPHWINLRKRDIPAAGLYADDVCNTNSTRIVHLPVQKHATEVEVETGFECHQSAYADDVNLIGDDIRTIERNADVLLNACKDIGLAVNIGKTKYMEIGCHRGVIANVHIKIGSNSFEKVKTFKYLGSLLTNHNYIQ